MKRYANCVRRRCAWHLSVTAWLLVGMSVVDSSADPTGNWQTKARQSCGPRSLVTAFGLLGHRVGLAECASLASTDANGITTMAGLATAANSLGGRVVGMHLEPAELAGLGRVAILHASVPYRLDHYVVCASVKEGLFNVINPTQSHVPQRYTADQLRLLWDGDCLVFTTTPFLDLLRVEVRQMRLPLSTGGAAALGLLAGVFFWRKMLGRRLLGSGYRCDGRLVLAMSCTLIVLAFVVLMAAIMTFTMRTSSVDNGPRLLLGTNVVELGEISRGRAAETDIWIANTGKSELRIDNDAIRASCACVRTAVKEMVLPSGAKQPLRIRVGPQNRLGPFRHSVHIPCNGHEGGKVLMVQGQIVGPGVVYPPRLYFGRITRDAKDLAKSFLYLTRSRETKIIRVACDSPYVNCRVMDQKPGVAQFEASLAAMPNEGNFEGTIVITTTDPASSQVSVPFSGILEAGHPPAT